MLADPSASRAYARTLPASEGVARADAPRYGERVGAIALLLSPAERLGGPAIWDESAKRDIRSINRSPHRG
jgi:hypothetical protein